MIASRVGWSSCTPVCLAADSPSAMVVTGSRRLKECDLLNGKMVDVGSFDRSGRVDLTHAP